MKNPIPYFLCLGLLALLQGCASTKVFEENTMIASDNSAAEVYFIRPGTERPLGMGDNVIQISIDDEPLLKLRKSEFVGIRLKPFNADIQVSIHAPVGRQAKMTLLTREERFSFKSGQRHYILLKMIDNEFRGLSYAPVLIGPTEAKEVLSRLHPIGKQAKDLLKNI